MDKVNELQEAILARAKRLAEQYREQARSGHAEILRDAAEKLRLREQREVLVAKAMAEKAYRRQVQSRELKLQARLDQLRWNLVTGIRERLLDELRTLVQDEAQYLPILRAFLQQGASQLQPRQLIVEANDTDRDRLSRDWEDYAALVNGKQLLLGEQTLDCIGGLRIRSVDNRIRFDNTFEGRLHRLEARLNKTVQERLIPPSAEETTIVMGTG
jgi:V/A-type H+-transporting ATPase subunit E